MHYTGHLNDHVSLRALYSAADVMVIPSRQDNLPNTGLEAHACGTPVVAFNTGGLPDIVDDRVTGALAEPFDPASLSSCIHWGSKMSSGDALLGQRQEKKLSVSGIRRVQQVCMRRFTEMRSHAYTIKE